jgi:lysophospholipase L1-like esterase
MESNWSRFGPSMSRRRGSFSPLQLTSLRAWYKSDVGITIATGVSQWNDQSGNGNHLVQATGGAQPLRTNNSINNLPAITFDGVNDFMVNAFTINQPETVFALVRQRTWTSSDIIFDGNVALSRRVVQSATSPGLIATSDTLLTQDNNLLISEFGLITFINDGAGSSFQINSNTAVTGNAGADVGGGFTVGARGTGALGHANVDFVELVSMAAVATPAEIAGMKSYFESRVRLSSLQKWLAVGDSLTSGTTGVPLWTNALSLSAQATALMMNAGVSGAVASAINTQWTTYSGRNPHTVFVMGGINNIVLDQSGASIFTTLSGIYTSAQGQGARVVAMTTLPFGAAASWTAGRQVQLDALNTSVMASGANIKIDLYTALEGTPDTLNAIYDSGDGIHPNAAGTALMASTIATALGI